MTNEQDLAELRILKAAIDHAQLDLEQLRLRLSALEERINPGIPELPEAMPPAAPAIPDFEFSRFETLPSIKETPEQLPPILGTENQAKLDAAESGVDQIKEAPPETSAPQAAESPSLEVRLGTYWFVRIGVVLVVTALAFLGNYAYQKYIPTIGPVGRISLLYLASFTLLGLGAWLPRRQEKFRNYGEVLFAAGLAAVYFTTYAAHHFPNVRVIQSEVLGGVLLLAWTGVIVYLADRRKSQGLALFGIGLAYYASLITDVGTFTLVSNTILACAAVWFLVRNRWMTLGFLSLAASYGSYLYWRLHSGTTHVDLGLRFPLVGYWIIFSSAVFLTRQIEFTGVRRAWFLSANNGFAFALLAFGYRGEFWQLAFASGGTLLGCAAASKKIIAGDALPKQAYLTQGLALVTLGVVTYFSGSTLPLVLAAESAILLVFSTQWNNRNLRLGSVGCGALAAGFALFRAYTWESRQWPAAVGILGCFIFNAIWANRKSSEEEDKEYLPLFYSAVGLGVWTILALRIATAAWEGPILAATALGLTWTFRLTRVNHLLICAQAVGVAAQLNVLFQLINGTSGLPDLSSLTVCAISVILSIWWKGKDQFQWITSLLFQAIHALAAILILYTWVPTKVSEAPGLIVFSLMTLAFVGIGIAIRSLPFIATGHVFLMGATFSAFSQVFPGQVFWGYLLAPVAGWTILAATAHVFALKSEEGHSKFLKILSFLYQAGGSLLGLACAVKFLPAEFRFISITAIGMGSLLIARTGALYFLPTAALFAATGLFCWLVKSRSFQTEMVNLLAILLLAGMQILLRRWPGSIRVKEITHRGWLVVVTVALWIFASRWIAESGAGPRALTAMWAGLAFVLFVSGMVIREQTYRWGGLVILAAAFVRVVLLDVWQFQTFHRILSLLALGIVLLALGYIYTRYQEKISKWL